MGWLTWLIGAIVAFFWFILTEWISGVIVLSFFESMEKDMPSILSNPTYIFLKYSLMLILFVGGIIAGIKLIRYL